jgi:uncharacterized repeat protein (TIGR04138 family)
MQKVGFSEALEQVLEQHPEYDREAYNFLREALEFTVKLHKKDKHATPQHVTAAELMDGLRQYALQEFGPMVPVVLEYWGIRNASDVGHMVFNLVEAGVFGKTEQDRIEDFEGALDFHEAFVAPFQVQTRGSSEAKGEDASSEPQKPSSFAS